MPSLPEEVPSLGALTSRRPRRVVVASSSPPRIALSCHPSAPLSSPPLSSPLSSPVSSSPDHSAGRRAVVSPCPPLSSPLSSPPGPHHSSPRRRRVYRYPHRSLGESMRRCSDCEGLGGCSEARVVVASSSRRRRLVSRGQEPLRKLVKTAGATPGATPAHSRRVVVVASPRSPSPLRPRARAVLHACSSSSRRASSGSHLASCTRVRRSKRPGKTHRDKYHESLRDVGGLYLAGSGQRQQ